MLLYKSLRAEPESRYLRERTYGQFQVAMSVDPWNPLVYEKLAQFLTEFPPSGGPPAGESPEELLVASISLDPLYLPGIDQLLSLYAASGEDAKRYSLLRNIVYPWMPTVRKRDPAASDRYFALLEDYARRSADTAFVAELEKRKGELSRYVPASPTYWFF
jgi:hypothetical protein